MTANEKRINQLFDELVPFSGKADTVAGELVRATARIGYRFNNDGDQLGIGYGKETTNMAGRYLIKHGNKKIGEIIKDMWALYDEYGYEKKLDELEAAVANYIEENPGLKGVKNDINMFDLYNQEEDVDDDEEEEW